MRVRGGARARAHPYLWQRLELVEERRDDGRVDGHEEEGEGQHEAPEVQRQVGAAHLQVWTREKCEEVKCGEVWRWWV